MIPRAKSERVVVLVPAYGGIDQGCELGLRALQERGYEVRRAYGNACIDFARSELATQALADGFDVLVWIDSDIRFRAEDVDRLIDENQPFVSAIAPKKGTRGLACHVLPNTQEITFGERGGLVELRYVGFSLVVTRRIVYEQMRDRLELPACNERFGSPVVPYFMPMVTTDERGPWYLGEDYAFCERARAVGVAIMADSRIRLHHVGAYPYSWEDAGRDVERFADYRFVLT